MEKRNRIVVDNVSKKFRIGYKKNQSVLSRLISLVSGIEPKKDIWALKNVSFNAYEGEIVGIIGENGSGKSSLLRIISEIYYMNAGYLKVNGKLISIIDLEIGLNERLTMKDNIYYCCSLFNLSNKKINEKFNSIVELSELEEFVNTKIYQFSIGMIERLIFSIAIHCDPEILLLDEAIEVGDESFKKKAAAMIKDLVKKGVTVLLVSHDLPLIIKQCDRVIWMDKGRIVKKGNPKEIVREYTQCSKN